MLIEITYKNYVEAVGKLILKGMWWSDAVKIVHILFGPKTFMSGYFFKIQVDAYVDGSGERVPKPQYKKIF
mgnify:CR=1 FL=1